MEMLLLKYGYALLCTGVLVEGVVVAGPRSWKQLAPASRSTSRG